MSESAIGIFDSGVGGLTVAREIMQRLPNEPILYLGDTARVPYGTKSPLTVVRYALAASSVLIARDIKVLVIACNTASVYALEAVQSELDIPVVGVVEPGARALLEATTNHRMGVIGTPGTIGSGQYQRVLEELSPASKVFARACPLFVPLAEEGWVDGDVPSSIASVYLSDLCEEGIDSLLLGCTHYPLLKQTISAMVGPSVKVVDSAEATAKVVESTVDAMEIRADVDTTRDHQFLVSDGPSQFAKVGKAFLGRDIDSIEWVDF